LELGIGAGLKETRMMVTTRWSKKF